LRIANRAKTKLRNRLRPPRVLSYVDAVARYGSIRKAAEALNVASSALNRQVLDLEMDLGAPLFERLPRGVRVTSAGEAFLVYARLVISELKAVESRIEQLRGLVRGQVSVAAAESVAGELLPSAITQFQATHPYVRFHVRIGAPEELVEALAADQVDLILTHDVPRKKDVAIIAIARQALCAMVVPDHPLASRNELHLRDCLTFPLALADTTLAGRGLIEQVLALASFDLDPRLVSNSVEAMKAFAHMNRGVCFQFRSPGKALIPTRRHGSSSINRSTFAASTIAARNATKSRASSGGRCVRRTAERRVRMSVARRDSCLTVT
jgi:DNA-binding transcriptional LysR family regulator